MDKKGKSKEEILMQLNHFQSKDLKYSDGRILGSMCTSAHPIAKEVYLNFLDSNLGDYGLFKGTKSIEDMVINEISSFLNGDSSSICGNVVSGGTEANLMAIRAARNLAIYEGKINIEDTPEVIVPKSAHFSFNKAADIMNLKLVEAELDDNYKIIPDSVSSKISKNTVAIVGIAGTTELGVIDPIEEIGKIANSKNIYFHVDAAFGGFSIPFLNDVGFNFPKFDFSISGVSSITIDPHKMGLAPIPAGCILFREKKFLDLISVDAPYLTSKQQSTIVGTRLGAPSAATWAVMEYMGRDGYGEIAKSCMDNTYFLSDKLKEMGYDLIVNPELNILAFNLPGIDTEILKEKIQSKNWEVSCSSYPKSIRIVIMPHIHRSHLLEFINDLKEIKNSL